MFRKGIMRKDTEMMTGNILDQSQRNKIIKDNQACSSGESADCSAGDLEGISPRCRAAAGIRAWHQEGELQGAVCLEHETTEERTMELCYNSEVKQLCLLMCQMETRFLPTSDLLSENATSEILWIQAEADNSPYASPELLWHYENKEKGAWGIKLSCGCRTWWTWPRNWLWNRFFLNSGNRKCLTPGGGLQLTASKHTGKVTVIGNTKSKLSFPPGHLIAVLNEWILINVGFLLVWGWVGREDRGKFKPSCGCYVVSELQKCHLFVLDVKLRLTSLLLNFGMLHSGLLQQQKHMVY